MEGLASSMAGNSVSAQPQNSQEDMLRQIIELLLQGTSPEELLQKGVPEELLIQAIEIIEQQMASEQGGQAMQPQSGQSQGLAESMADQKE